MKMEQYTMETILVIGASGFVGRHLTKALLAQGHHVRCLMRNPPRVQDRATANCEIVQARCEILQANCEIVQGDISDLLSVQSAMKSVKAVYIAIHTLSSQLSPKNNLRHPRFMEIEKNGLQNVIMVGRLCGVRRIVYVTSLGTSPDAPSEWLRERWNAEQSLLCSGLDATVIRPGMIVGAGGRGFDSIVSNAKRRISVALGGDSPKMRTIAVDDLVYYLTGVLSDTRAYGQCYDVGNDDVLSINQLIDTTADLLGRSHPIKTQIPLPLISTFSPLIERMGKLATGAMRGFVDSINVDMIGDPLPIRTILPQPLLTFRQASEQALTNK
jgi:nucleoside-diphosphate-sugar epimerase